MASSGVTHCMFPLLVTHTSLTYYSHIARMLMACFSYVMCMSLATMQYLPRCAGVSVCACMASCNTYLNLVKNPSMPTSPQSTASNKDQSCAVHAVQCSACCAVQCMLCSACCAVHAVQCMLCSAVHAVQCMLCSAVHAVQCMLCSAVHAVQCMLCSACCAVQCSPVHAVQCSACCAVHVQFML
jgi:hypothetical protein